MKLLIFIALVFSSLTTLADTVSISEDTAVLIARAYVIGKDYPADGSSVNEEIYKADLITESTYNFTVLDASGDCALLVVVNFDGSIDQLATKETCI